MYAIFTNSGIRVDLASFFNTPSGKEALKKVADSAKPPSAQPEPPYKIVEVVTVERRYNPNYGDDRICKCGHTYYRHFDSWENMENVGCKYCGCEFEEQTDVGSPTTN